jgi:hypothetical protein
MGTESCKRVVVLVLAALACAACTSRAGPVVKDVRYASDGRLVVERCDLVLTYAPFQNVPDLSLEDCRIGPPKPAE